MPKGHAALPPGHSSSHGHGSPSHGHSSPSHSHGSPSPGHHSPQHHSGHHSPQHGHYGSYNHSPPQAHGHGLHPSSSNSTATSARTTSPRSPVDPKASPRRATLGPSAGLGNSLSCQHSPPRPSTPQPAVVRPRTTSGATLSPGRLLPETRSSISHEQPQRAVTAGGIGRPSTASSSGRRTPDPMSPNERRSSGEAMLNSFTLGLPAVCPLHVPGAIGFACARQHAMPIPYPPPTPMLCESP